ncbi:MAG: hypothetical protein DMF06_03495 [Verrucomicrobia bacterium]|nr:MAG: hypothetical protein DMF06_03495 [Verrucomicrobiota bacterium]
MVSLWADILFVLLTCLLACHQHGIAKQSAKLMDTSQQKIMFALQLRAAHHNYARWPCIHSSTIRLWYQ